MSVRVQYVVPEMLLHPDGKAVFDSGTVWHVRVDSYAQPVVRRDIRPLAPRFADSQSTHTPVNSRCFVICTSFR
jgi:hypothetical protein